MGSLAGLKPPLQFTQPGSRHWQTLKIHISRTSWDRVIKFLVFLAEGLRSVRTKFHYNRVSWRVEIQESLKWWHTKFLPGFLVLKFSRFWWFFSDKMIKLGSCGLIEFTTTSRGAFGDGYIRGKTSFPWLCQYLGIPTGTICILCSFASFPSLPEPAR